MMEIGTKQIMVVIGRYDNLVIIRYVSHGTTALHMKVIVLL